MIKKLSSTTIIVLAIILTITYIAASTYSVIINVTEKNEILEIINKITIKDLVTNEDGSYNNTYYLVKNELNISEEEANLIMESEKLNENLQIVLDSIVKYKVQNNQNAKLSNERIYDLILDGTNKTENFSEELKNKILDKSNLYKQDISNFLYDIDVSLIKD